MSYVSIQSHSVLDRIASPLRAVGELFATLAVTAPHMSDVERLSRLTDDELTALGTSRQGELNRILGAHALL